MSLDKNQHIKSGLHTDTNEEIIDFDVLKNQYDQTEKDPAKDVLKPFVIHKKNKTEKVLRVETIHSAEQFCALEKSWNQLLETATCQNPFVTWDWMYTWWEVFGKENNSLYILTIYKDNSLVAIAPFYLQKRFKLFSRLGFIGEGEKKSDAITTHYPDIIVSKDNQKTAVSHIIHHLTNRLESDFLFDYARFDLIKPDAVIHKVTQGLSKSLKTKNDFTGNQFIVPLPKDGDEYIASLSKSARKQFRLKGNRLEKVGKIEIQSETDNAKGLEIVEKLHRSRWEGVVPTNIFDSEDFKSFHKTLANRVSGKNIVDIRTMTLDGNAIVASYNFHYNNTCYSYLSGFESEDDHRLSPMFTFDLREMKQLIKAGYHSFDLLVSESDSNYKKRFGSEIVPCERVLWISNSSSSLLFKSYFSIKSRLIKTYKKLRKP